MKRLKKLLGWGYFAGAMAVLFSFPARAYLDPGTLTYVISMLAGLVIAGGAAVAIFWRKIKRFFQGLGKKKDDAPRASAGSLGDDVDPMADMVDPMAGDKD